MPQRLQGGPGKRRGDARGFCVLVRKNPFFMPHVLPCSGFSKVSPTSVEASPATLPRISASLDMVTAQPPLPARRQLPADHGLIFTFERQNHEYHACMSLKIIKRESCWICPGPCPRSSCGPQGAPQGAKRRAKDVRKTCERRAASFGQRASSGERDRHSRSLPLSCWRLPIGPFFGLDTGQGHGIDNISAAGP